MASSQGADCERGKIIIIKYYFIRRPNRLIKRLKPNYVFDVTIIYVISAAFVRKYNRPRPTIIIIRT